MSEIDLATLLGSATVGSGLTAMATAFGGWLKARVERARDARQAEQAEHAARLEHDATVAPALLERIDQLEERTDVIQARAEECEERWRETTRRAEECEERYAELGRRLRRFEIRSTPPRLQAYVPTPAPDDDPDRV